MIELTRRRLILNGAILAGFLPHVALGYAATPIAPKVAAILAKSKSNSFLQSKLALDALLAPSSPSLLTEIDRLADAVRQMAGPNPTDRYKLAAIRKTIYESGLWNRHRAFAYDHKDPFGEKVSNKLLDSYFKTRLGNCVSMPILFLILAERAGMNVGLATAPLHVFIRYTDPAGAMFNIEATSGGHFARDEEYRKNRPMTDRAIESGIYLRTLNKAESVAVMASTVLDFLMDQRRYQEAMDVADAILAVNPRDVYAMLKKGSAATGLIDIEFAKKYPIPALIPPNLVPRYQNLIVQNRQTFADAELLGWTPEN